MQFFPVELEAGVVYQVDIKGVDTGDGTMDYPMLANIAAPDGSYVGGTTHLFVQGGGEGRNVRYVFTADQDGMYFLKAGGALWKVYDVMDNYIGTRYRAGTFTVSIQETEEAPSCTLNRGDLWCGVVTVGHGGGNNGYDTENVNIGDLSDTDVDVGPNSYTIIGIFVDGETSVIPRDSQHRLPPQHPPYRRRPGHAGPAGRRPQRYVRVQRRVRRGRPECQLDQRRPGLVRGGVRHRAAAGEIGAGEARRNPSYKAEGGLRGRPPQGSRSGGRRAHRTPGPAVGMPDGPEDAGWYEVQYHHIDQGSADWLDLPAVGVDVALYGSSAVVSNLDGLSWLRVRAVSCAGASEWSGNRAVRDQGVGLGGRARTHCGGGRRDRIMP